MKNAQKFQLGAVLGGMVVGAAAVGVAVWKKQKREAVYHEAELKAMDELDAMMNETDCADCSCASTHTVESEEAEETEEAEDAGEADISRTNAEEETQEEPENGEDPLTEAARQTAAMVEEQTGDA
jgi:ribosomal protein S1